MNRQPYFLSSLLAAFSLSLSFAAVAHDDTGRAAAEPALPHYSLILPANLPHLVWAMKGQSATLALDEAQRGRLATIAFEARDAFLPRLREVQMLEREVAQTALAGKAVAALTPELDRLQRLKREVTELHIDFVNRLRADLSAAQYAQLLHIAAAQPEAGPGVTPARESPPKAEPPALPDYSLILPANLPHLMQFVSRLDLAEAQKRVLNGYAEDEVRPALRPRLQEAQRIEQEIGRAALDGQTKQELAESLNRLMQVKREAAEIHLRCIERVRQTLSREQYAQLMAQARPAAGGRAD